MLPLSELVLKTASIVLPNVAVVASPAKVHPSSPALKLGSVTN